MTVVTAPDAAGSGPSGGRLGAPRSILTPRRGSTARKIRNRIAFVWIVLMFLVALVPLVAIVVYVFQRGMQVLDADFLTKPIPISDRIPGPGMGPAVVGTFLITGAAALMAIPLGILGGVYVNEYGGRGPLARLVRFMAEVMTGVPSVVMGLFVYIFVVLRTKEQNGLAGALALACLMLPVVLRTTDEMLRLVPGELREGSYALGARKARTIRKVVFPNAAAGIVSGALLAVARAAGETAPLLFTIGIVSESNWSLTNGPNTTLSYQIFRNAASPFPGAQDRAWGAALALVIIVFVTAIAARIVTAIFSRRQGA
jgi:phosphate transport system permease protein